MNKHIFQWVGILLIALGVGSYQLISHLPNSSAPETGVNPKYITSNAVSDASEKPVNSLKDFNDAIVEIAENTNPAVVTITTEQTIRMQSFPSNPFFDFFGQPSPREQRRSGLGSGVIVSKDGYILTNNHVIANADKIKVKLFEGDEVDAEVVGTDPQTDIAVLKIKGDDFKAVKLGDSDKLRVGEFVLAIGSPLSSDLAHTVSFGIVSARGRALNDLTIYGDYIQTDAAINPGNSGGALINTSGELVGINSAIASRSGGNDGIGFAIPVNLAKRIMDDLVKDGSVRRGYIGIYFGGEVDQTLARALGNADLRGILVSKVEEGSPAAKAGLEERDVITKLNGETVRNWDAFRTKIASFKPGEQVDLEVMRSGKVKNINLIIGTRPDEEIASAAPEKTQKTEEMLGFNVIELTPDIRRQLRVEADKEGVVVQNISSSSEAYKRGLQRGDIITHVSNNAVKTPREFINEIDSVRKKDAKVALLTILRGGAKQFIAFEL